MAREAGVIVGGKDFERELESLSHKIAPTINDAIRANSPRLAHAAQIRAHSIQITSSGKRGKRASYRSGLRREIAQAIGAEYQNEKVVFSVKASGLSDDRQAMVILSASRSWRHPVYGNTKVWVEQQGDVAWFSKAIYLEANRVLPSDIKRAIEELVK